MSYFYIKKTFEIFLRKWYFNNQGTVPPSDCSLDGLLPLGQAATIKAQAICTTADNLVISVTML